MTDPKYKAFTALDPFFDIVQRGLLHFLPTAENMTDWICPSPIDCKRLRCATSSDGIDNQRSAPGSSYCVLQRVCAWLRRQCLQDVYGVSTPLVYIRQWCSRVPSHV